MFSFFRINDPYRLAFVFLALILLRIPYLFGDQTPLLEEIHWMALGESLSLSKVLYRDIIDNTAPFSALTYWLIDNIFGRNLLIYHWFAALLIFLQAAVFNRLLIQNKALDENTYSFALIFVVLCTAAPDFMTLSPPLMANTFLLLALRNIYLRMDKVLSDEAIFFTGFYLGITITFYLPAIFPAAILLLALFVYTNIILRRIILSSLGFALPLIMMLLVYLLQNHVGDFFLQYIYYSVKQSGIVYFEYDRILLFYAVPTVIFMFSIIFVFRNITFNNYQSRILQILSLLFIMGTVTLFFSPVRMPYFFIFMVAPASYFITIMIMKIRRVLVAELLFMFITAIISLNYYGQKKILGSNPYEKATSSNILSKSPEKSALLIDHSFDTYAEYSASGPLLNSSLRDILLADDPNAMELILFYKLMIKSKPDLIFDKNHLLDVFFSKIPELKTAYKKSSIGYRKVTDF